MGSQLNIRSERARALAAELAVRYSKPIARIVEEALEAYAAAGPGVEDRESTLRYWNGLLEADRLHLDADGFEIEDLYDPATGLPG